MRTTILIFALLLSIPTTPAADTNTVTKIAADQLLTLSWEHQRDDDGDYYRLFAGTNLLQTLQTNEFTIVGTTNGLSTIRARVAGVPKGTNVFTVRAVNVVALESDPSNLLPVKALGKPLPPQALQKP